MRLRYFLPLAALLAGCSLPNHESNYLTSPSGSYAVKSRVNRTVPEHTDYALVTLLLFDRAHRPLDSLNTHAPDVMAWAVGWGGVDTVVLYSNEVSQHAWAVANRRFQPVPLTPGLAARANSIYQQKYAD